MHSSANRMCKIATVMSVAADFSETENKNSVRFAVYSIIMSMRYD